MEELSVWFTNRGATCRYTDHTLALYRDESKLYRFGDAQTTKTSIDIYSCSGRHINRINVCIPFFRNIAELCCSLTNMSSGNQVLSEDSAGPTGKNSWWSLKTAPCDDILVCTVISLRSLWEMYSLHHLEAMAICWKLMIHEGS